MQHSASSGLIINGWLVNGKNENEDKCPRSCPECHGNGSIGGDTESMWACTRWTGRVWRNMIRERAFVETLKGVLS